MLEVGKQILSHPKMMDPVRNMSILSLSHTHILSLSLSFSGGFCR
jgi:hypothetical protein